MALQQGGKKTSETLLPLQVISASLYCNLEWCRKYILLLLSTLKAKKPTRHETSAAHQIMDKMRAKYTDENEQYLVDLYVKAGLSSNQQQYVRKGDIWKELGFQNHDPVSDIRGGGILCLDNMLYFLKVHRHVAQAMIRKRAKGWDTYETYPWAPASINLTRLVASEFGICGPGGQLKTMTGGPFPPKTSYHMLLESDGFSRIYVLAFLLLDKVWDEEEATYMQFNSVLETVRSELSEAIILATSLQELEQQVYRRVQYTPLHAVLVQEDSTTQSSSLNIESGCVGNDISTNERIFNKAIYPSISELEEFLCAPPTIEQENKCCANDQQKDSCPSPVVSDFLASASLLSFPSSSLSSHLRQRKRIHYQ